ncbi:MAG: PAS domain S-box protein [Opitutae bacterium]|nr:PAS domain S-box protein [Opitutae bacterium]
MPQLSARAVTVCRELSRAVGLALGAIALAVLMGWWLDIPLFKSLMPGWAAMKPNTALALLLSAASLLPMSQATEPMLGRWRWWVRVTAGLAALIGGLTFMQHVARIDLGIDQLLVREVIDSTATAPGRMSPMAAVAFLVLGIALSLLTCGMRAVCAWLAQLAALLAAFGAFIAVTGYLYGRATLGLAPFFTSTALHTALALLTLSVGVACAQPTDGLMALFNARSAGGTILRRLLLPIALLPVLINWLEREGEQRGIYPIGFGWMLDSAVTVVLVGCVVWIVARRVHEKDVARQTAEEELQKSEERYRQLIEMSPVAILVKDAKKIEFANPAAQALVGATQATDVLGRSPFAFVHPAARSRFEKDFCRVIRDGTSLPRMDHRVVRIDGSEIDVEISATPVSYHGQRLAQVVARDVTEARRAAQALRESEERFRQIAETISEVFWMADIKLERMVYVSPAYEKIWGRSCASLRENPRSFLDAIHPGDRKRVLADLEVKKQGLLFEHEYRLLLPDGSIRWIWDRGYPVRTPGNEVLHYVGVAQDITSRKQVQEALKASVERLQLLARATGDAIWDWDIPTDTTWWSETFRSKFGYAQDTVPTFAAWLDHVHPDDRERATAEFRDAVETAEITWSSEYRFRLADGSYAVVLDRAHGIKDNSGKLVRILGSIVDISGLRRVEEKARLLAHAVESTSEMISIASLDDRFVFVNPAFLNAYGYREDEVIGQTPELLASPATKPPGLHAAIREAAMREGWTGEVINRRKDGSEFQLRLIASSVRDTHGNIIALMGVAEDITERKRIEAIVRRDAYILAQLRDAVICTDLAGNITYWNEAATEILGWSAQETLGRSFLQFHPQEEHAERWARFERVLAGEILQGERQSVRKNGTRIWVSSHITLFRDTTGAPTGVISVARDITERRKLESQLLHTQKMDAIGQLAGGVAHDFNNMLTAIQGQAALMGMSGDLSSTARESLDEITRAAQRAASLTRQLLLFSRREVMQSSRIDLNEAITQIAKMLQRLIGEDVSLTLHLHPRPLLVVADAGMIDQVLMNLAVNARDAMPKGGEITIETSTSSFDTVTVDMGGAELGRYACVAVTDTGTGIPQHVLPHIFEPFFTTKEPGKGTGLGLATVFGIAKQHRGWVRVYSEPGHGTTFRVYLPVDGVAMPDETKDSALSLPRGRGERILLVEDDAAVRNMTSVMLERHGYKVISAANGREALNIWTGGDGKIDLLLTDMVMPGGMNGTDLAAQLRAWRADLKVILTSGYNAVIAGRALTLQPGQAFLQKPFDPAKLLGALESLLRGSFPAVE